MYTLSPRQSHDEIRSNLFPLPLGYSQGLQQSSGSFLLSLDFLLQRATYSATSLHSVPVIGCLEIMVHLIPSGMNGISGLVGLLKYPILPFLDIRHTNPSFVPQHTLVVFRKFGKLLFHNIALYSLDLLIFQLTFLYILKKCLIYFHLHDFRIIYHPQIELVKLFALLEQYIPHFQLTHRIF
jgi:hypothetical protein